MKTKLLLVAIVLSSFSWGQTTVFTDAFGTSAGASYSTTAGAIGTSSTWSFTRSGVDFGARINGGILDVTNDASASANVLGWVFANTATSSFLSPYNSTLSSNSGDVTWNFNMRQIRATASGFSTTTSYGMATVLGCTSTTAATVGNGYAVTIGASGFISLIRYTGGLQGTQTSLIANSTNAGTNYYSIRVIYTPSTNTWQLLTRNDGASAFADPSTGGGYTNVGSLVNNTYTGVALANFGVYWQGSTGATQPAFFDNLSITVTPICTPPTTQASALTTSSPTPDGFSAGWTAGSGSGTMIVVRPTANANTLPANGTSYTPNVAWTSAAQIDANNRVVFRAAGTSAGPVTGLTAQTQYTVSAYEYNTTGNCYNTTSPPSVTRYTLSLEPAAHAASATATAVSSNQINLAFSAASTISNADGYIILGRSDGATPTTSGVLNGVVSGSWSLPVGTSIISNISSTATTTFSHSSLLASTTYCYLLIPYNWDATNAATYNYRIAATVPSACATTLAPSPEINVKQGVASIAHNGSQAFATIAIGTTTDLVFTIENTGTANLTFTTPLSASGDYSIIAPAASSPVAASGTTTFTVRFTPTATGTRTGSITIGGTNDSDEPNYTINFTGTGTPSNLSDIIANATYVYNSNIPYATYQIATITNTSNSIDLFKFDIRDGGATADADGLPTILSGITFNVTNTANIRTAALFNGNALVNATPVINTGSGTIAFSGLSGVNVTAADGSVNSLTLRVSFLATVTDNQQIQVIIANANFTAAASNTSSLFTTFTAVVSSTTTDRNRIEVTADRLAFGTQPTSTAQNAAMSSAPTVRASDVNGNSDLDYTTAIVITSTGSMTGAPISVAPTSGVSTFSGIVHTSVGTYTLGATSGILTTATSNSFIISSFSFAVGDFRPLYATDLSFNGDWEYFNGSSWVAVPDAKAPQNTITAINRVLINNYVSGGGSNTKAYNCDFIIQAGGELDILANDIPPVAAQMMAAGKNIEVLSGGILTIQGDIDVAPTTNLIVRDGGTMTINQNSIVNNHPMWDGVELFESGSTVVINDWDFAASSTVASLINVSTALTSNANGWKFGNLILDINTTFNWQMIGGGIGIINLCENDFSISNAGTGYVTGATNSTGTNGFVVNGNMIIYDGNFSFGSSYSNNAFNHQFTVNGNFECGSNDNLKVHFIGLNTPTTLSGSVTFKGDVKVASTVTSFTNDGGSGTPSRMTVNFDGGTLATPKLIDIAPTAVAIPMTVKGTSTRMFATQDLTTNSVTSYTTPFTVETGGALHFGWATNGTTPLVIKKTTSSPLGTNTFITQTGTTLISTSLDGLQKASATTGNVQYVSSNKTFDQTATFWYVGKDNQVTGDAITVGGTAKTIICELIDNTKILTLSTSTSIITPGLLNIKKGQFVETTTEMITGSTGGLTMEDGTRYIIPSLSASSSDLIPRLEGLSNVYNLLGTSTIVLNGADGVNAFDQYLRGQRNYRNLTFSISGTKTISSAILGPTNTITGTITVSDAAILNVEDKTMGGVGTNLTMTGTSQYITAGVDVKPDATGTYALGTGTKVIFTSGSVAVPVSTLQQIRLAPNYYNIDVVGNNVGTNTLTTPIKIQTGGTFAVKATGLFKHSNTLGFNGGTTTAIDNTNSPTITLDTNSTVEYAGANQTISYFNAPYYTNVNVSGTGTKTLQNTTLTWVNEDLNVNTSLLQLNTAEILTVKQAVKVASGGTFEIKNNGQLIQVDDSSVNTCSGTFSMARTATVARTTDYVYWSSPVSGFQVGNVSTSSSLRYKWVPTLTRTCTGCVSDFGGWLATPATETMEIGKGYIIRGPYDVPTALFSNATAPNNGAISVGVQRSTYDGADYTYPSGTYTLSVGKDNDNYNLIGNPYPSAVDVEKFLTLNTNLEDGVRLWTHGTSIGANGQSFYNSFTYTYTTTDYVTANLTGLSSVPMSYDIAAGQGFFVTLKHSSASASENVVFNNSMRRDAVAGAAYNNGIFYRKANNSTNRKGRIWLDILDDSGSSVRTLVGYLQDATVRKDRLFDAQIKVDTNLNIYSLIKGEPQIIQGRPSPLDNEDRVPIGVVLRSKGSNVAPSTNTYTIAIAFIDGVFENKNQDIYLEDKYLNIVHNLKQQPYIFKSESGRFDTRFVLRYTNTNTLGDTDFNNLDNSVVVSSNGSEIKIKSFSSLLKHVTVYDLLGRKIYTNNSLKEDELLIQNRVSSQQVLIVKIRLEDGKTVTKKIVN